VPNPQTFDHHSTEYRDFEATLKELGGRQKLT
jgi:hypothetical protein